jgi:hypothetical protein
VGRPEKDRDSFLFSSLPGNSNQAWQELVL